jgi:hypothetical protein
LYLCFLNITGVSDGRVLFREETAALCDLPVYVRPKLVAKVCDVGSTTSTLRHTEKSQSAFEHVTEPQVAVAVSQNCVYSSCLSTVIGE